MSGRRGFAARGAERLRLSVDGHKKEATPPQRGPASPRKTGPLTHIRRQSRRDRMATTANTVTDPLPREMEQHTYTIMYEVEGKHWWFAGRRRIITEFVEKACQAVASQRPRILDVGCGTGANLQMLAEFGDAEGVDVSTAALDFCRARGLSQVKQGAAESLPFADASFDLVTGLDVVEHLDDDVAGLREIRRVLRPDGRAVLFVPAFMFLWGVQDDISHHRRRYTLPELKQKLRDAGLEVERASYANVTFFVPIL